MNQNPISQDDPRLTAYALDEMTPAERAEFEPLLRQDAAAQKAVDEIRAAGALFATALEHEPAGAELAEPAAEPKRGGLLRFPQFYYMVSGLAAACFAMFFVYWQRNQWMEPKQYMEVPLTAAMDAHEKDAKKTEVAAEAAARQSAAARADGLLAQATNEYRLNKDREPGKIAVAMPVAPAESQELVALDKSQMVADARNAPSANAVSYAPAAKQKAALDTFEGKTDAAVSGDKLSFATTVADAAPAPAPTLAATGGASFGAEKAKETVARDEVIQLESFMVAAAPSANYIGGRTQTFAARRRAEPASSTEAYSFRKDSDYLRVADQPLSTFSIDVDTASYANVRRFLQQGRRPPADAVRIEELVNYFPYHYTPPAGNVPFAVALESASAPWNPAHRLVRIGLKGREVADSQRPPANLVFLLDVSGSMNEPNKLPLVKQSLRLLVNRLRADDRVAIAVYAGASGLALPSTSAAHKAEILDAIDRLEAAGSTNGAMGIQLAYDLAKANFVPGGVNRVILATDGDFNVGVTSEGGLVRLVQEKAKSGVFLSVLGFGMGNLKDSTLEQLADKGNGNYAYIDSLAEARKALVEQAGGTLLTIAKDVKIQVEFNPAVVSAYRLIGYENRLLAKEDFNNDQVDAGDIGAGHTVTALYEVVPVGAEQPATGKVDALKYQVPATQKSKIENQKPGEMLTVKIRYKEPAGDVSSKLEFPLRDGGAAFASASPDFKFAAAVAAFGLVLRDSPDRGASTLADITGWAREGLEDDAGGHRAEFINLVERAATLQ